MTTDTGPTTWIYNDGGRAAAGFKGTTGDCLTRAVAIAERRPYREVYDEVNALGKTQRKTARRKAKASARTGLYADMVRRWLTSRGWKWVPTMHIGSGTTVHLRQEELPGGTIIARVSGHFCAVIDGYIRDTYDPSREGTRAVYGYFVRE